MTREEFAKKWGHERTMNTMGLPVTIPKYDEFLADLDSLFPPAEGAEEIQPTAYEWHNLKTGHCYVDYVPHLDAKEGYTKIPLYSSLHAQRLAGKMVEDMRQKLFSMRSTKEAMDKLSEADRLMQYGYHDCINEMLMWTKKLSHD